MILSYNAINKNQKIHCKIALIQHIIRMSFWQWFCVCMCFFLLLFKWKLWHGIKSDRVFSEIAISQ